MFNSDVSLCTYISNSKKADCILCIHRHCVMDLICQGLLQLMQFSYLYISQKINTLRFYFFLITTAIFLLHSNIQLNVQLACVHLKYINQQIGEHINFEKY